MVQSTDIIGKSFNRFQKWKIVILSKRYKSKKLDRGTSLLVFSVTNGPLAVTLTKKLKYQKKIQFCLDEYTILKSDGINKMDYIRIWGIDISWMILSVIKDWTYKRQWKIRNILFYW